jgi:hypothetical protein
MARRGSDRPPTDKPDLILHRGSFTTLDRSNPVAMAVAITEAPTRVPEGAFRELSNGSVPPDAARATQLSWRTT